MDVDGTMTDGGVTLLSQLDGTSGIKNVDAHDGQGPYAGTAGSKRLHHWPEKPALLRRAHEMRMDYVYMKVPCEAAYEKFLAEIRLGRFPRSLLWATTCRTSR